MFKRFWKRQNNQELDYARHKIMAITLVAAGAAPSLLDYYKGINSNAPTLKFSVADRGIKECTIFRLWDDPIKLQAYKDVMEEYYKNSPKILYLVRGVPGSGKSTTARGTGIPNHFEADMFFGDDYKFDASLLKMAHSWCFASTYKALLNNESVVVANTFTTVREMEKYLRLADTFDIKVIVHQMHGKYGSIHNVPEDVIKRMEDRFVDINDFPPELLDKIERIENTYQG